MTIWLFLLLFILCIWGLFSKRGSAVGNIGVVGVVLLVLVFAVILAIGALTAS